MKEYDIEKIAGRRMIRRFGFLYYLSGMGFLLRRLRIRERSIENVEQAQEQGQIVYVLYARSKMDWLALNRVLQENRLPLAVHTSGLRSLLFRPFLDICQEGWILLKQWFSGEKHGKRLLKESVRRGDPIAITLVRPTSTGSSPTGAIRNLFELYKEFEETGVENIKKNIQFLPVAVVWNRRPEKLRSDTMKFLLGAEDEPGPIQKMYYVASRDHEPIVQIGAPIAIEEIFEHYKNTNEERQIRAVRLLLRRYLYRESHVIRGPRVRSHSWMKKLVVDSAVIKKLIEDEHVRTGKPKDKIRKKVLKTFDHIAARFSFRTVSFIAKICHFIWNRIYSGVDIREEDIQRFQDAVRDGTPILIPSHRSHLDYLLISSEFFKRGLVLPHVVAGENLAFFPAGSLIRRCGAFVIKRSFKNERIFPVVFTRYVQILIRDGFPIEFFIEGGRSRTGKLLYPKLGVLSMVTDASSLMRNDQKVSLLPVAVSYEQIAEEKSYAKELGGGKKKKESIFSIFSASKVILKRFGKVYIRIGEPIIVNEEIQQYEKPWSQLTEQRRREVLGYLGERIMHRIGRNMLILPTGVIAMAILCEPSMGIKISTLRDRSRRFDYLLRTVGAQSGVKSDFGGWAVQEALERFLSEGWIKNIDDESEEIIQVLPQSRITMEYYKNGILHHVATTSMLASAILGVMTKDEQKSLVDFWDEIFNLFQYQVFLFRYEFLFNPELSVEELCSEALQYLVKYTALQSDSVNQENNQEENEENTSEKDVDTYTPEHLTICSRSYLNELSGLTQNFLESYYLTLRACHAMRQRQFDEKSISKHIQVYGKARISIRELLYEESLSSVSIKNAIRAFREEGVLSFLSDGNGFVFDEQVYNQYINELRILCRISESK